jgi:hypothetical protein
MYKKHKNINKPVLILFLFVYCILAEFFVLRINQPSNKILSIDQLNNTNNMIDTDEINQILNFYEEYNTKKNQSSLDVKQAVTHKNGEITLHSDLDPENGDKTIFAEVNLQNGATGDLLEVAKNFKMGPLPVFGTPNVRGLKSMGTWSRKENNFIIDNFYKLSNDSQYIDNRFIDTPENPALFNLYKDAVIEQLSSMYDLNMLNDKKFDSGDFMLYLVELPAMPIGMNPFTIGKNYHQDGIQNTVPKDPELDNLKIESRRSKGFNYTFFGPKLSLYDSYFTMTYENDVITADNRHISDDEFGNTNITDIPSVTAGNTAILNQRHGIQHAQVATGALLDKSIRSPRRAILMIFTEDGDKWEPRPNQTRLTIY